MLGSFGQLLGGDSILCIDDGGSSVFSGPAILIACSLEQWLTVTSVQGQLGIESEQLPLSRASSGRSGCRRPYSMAEQVFSRQ
jgi:hypothetical protein